MNNDGIGDAPYSIDSDKDNYPLMVPWENYFPSSVTLPTATGTGDVEISTSDGYFVNATCMNESDMPEEGKPSLVFPHGFFCFTIAGLTPGQSVTLTITLPSPVPIGSLWWKVNTTAGNNTWYSLPIGDDDGDNVVTITLKDGGLGNNDGVATGVIVDPGGLGIPREVEAKVPALTPLGILTLIGVLTIVFTLSIRRKRG